MVLPFGFNATMVFTFALINICVLSYAGHGTVNMPSSMASSQKLLTDNRHGNNYSGSFHRKLSSLSIAGSESDIRPPIYYLSTHYCPMP